VQKVAYTWMTLPYCMQVPSSFLFSLSFCFFSSSAACCHKFTTQQRYSQLLSACLPLHSLLSYHNSARSPCSSNTNLLSIPRAGTTFAFRGFSNETTVNPYMNPDLPPTPKVMAYSLYYSDTGTVGYMYPRLL